MKRNGHAVEVGMQFAVVEVEHGVESGTCVKLYNTGFGGPFWVPLTDVIAVAGDGVSDADVSQRANMLATLRQMQSAIGNRQFAECRVHTEQTSRGYSNVVDVVREGVSH